MNDAVPAEGVRTYRRRRLVAVLLTLLGGIGYLYVGRPGRFALYLLAGLVTWIPLVHGLWGYLSDPTVFLGFLVLSAAILIAFLVDVAAIARREQHYRLRWYNRPLAYVAFFLLSLGISFLPELALDRTELAVRSYSIPSGSMMPTLLIGDVVLADARAYEKAEPQRGDVVIFKLPSDGETDYIKRIIGLPGERVQMVNGQVLIDGAAVPREKIADYEYESGRLVGRFQETLSGGRSYETLDTVSGGPGDDTGPFDIPAGHYFVLGDNRDNSVDGRMTQLGFVPSANIYAKAGGIILSKDPGRIGSRLNSRDAPQ